MYALSLLFFIFYWQLLCYLSIYAPSLFFLLATPLSSQYVFSLITYFFIGNSSVSSRCMLPYHDFSLVIWQLLCPPSIYALLFLFLLAPPPSSLDMSSLVFLFAPHQSPLDVCSLFLKKKIIGNSSVISRCLNARVATMALIHAVGAEGDCATQLYSDLRHLVLWRDPLLTGHTPTHPSPPHHQMRL